jgi:hypothetical protein
MDLVYFIEDICKKYNCSEAEKRKHFYYLYSLLPKDSIIKLNDKLCSFKIRGGVRRFQECGHLCVENNNYCEKHLNKINKENKK